MKACSKKQMVITLNSDGSLELSEHENMHDFALSVDESFEGGIEAVAEKLGSNLSDAEEMEEEDHVWVSVELVRSLADSAIDGGTDKEWEAEFTAMLDYAELSGWLSPDSSLIKTHIEWT